MLNPKQRVRQFLFAGLVSAASVALIQSSAGAAVQLYAVVDLGHGYAGEARGVDGTTYVGNLGVGTTFEHAVTWSATQNPVYLQTGTYDNSSATSINSSGIIAGWSEFGATSVSDIELNNAVLWVGGALVELAEPAGGTNSYADAINSSGMATGTWDTLPAGTTSNADFHAARWNIDHSVVDLSSAGEMASAGDAINDQGTIAGYRYYAGSGQTPNYYRAVIWAPDNTATVLPDLFGYGGIAQAINDSGEVAGVDITSADQTVPFYYQGGQIHALPTIPGLSDYEVTGINSAGAVIGYASAATATGTEALLWENGQVYNLQTLLQPYDSPEYGTVTLSTPFAIDNNGDIAASGVTSNYSATRPYLLAAVPEPGSLAILVCGAGALVKRPKRWFVAI